VSRACANLAYEEVDAVWSGFAFEALIINEVRAYNRYLKKARDLFYYRYNGGYEIDLLIEHKVFPAEVFLTNLARGAII
jgi:predicted AAA+ superfamily ATPase